MITRRKFLGLIGISGIVIFDSLLTYTFNTNPLLADEKKRVSRREVKEVTSDLTEKITQIAKSYGLKIHEDDEKEAEQAATQVFYNQLSKKYILYDP